LALRDDTSASLHYVVTNTGPHPLAALWAAHPQFTATPHTRIRLPDQVSELYNVRDILAWGDWGLRYAWPETTNRHGERVRLDRIAPPEARTCRKMYVPLETPIDWAGLVEEDAHHGLFLQWKQTEIPYLGIWVDEGAVNTVATVALEITDGFHDSLETAWENQRCPIIPPGEQRRWQVELRVGESPVVDSRI
jgi:galactose mutarotase-like enzyme